MLHASRLLTYQQKMEILTSIRESVSNGKNYYAV